MIEINKHGKEALVAWILKCYYLLFHYPELLFKGGGLTSVRIGFKATTTGLTCNNKKYSIGEVFAEDSLRLCQTGMHYCKYPWQTVKFYNHPENRLFLVAALGDIIVSEDKCVTNKLIFIRELPKWLIGSGPVLTAYNALKKACFVPISRILKEGNARGLSTLSYIASCLEDVNTCSDSFAVMHATDVSGCSDVYFSEGVHNSVAVRCSSSVCDSRCVTYSSNVEFSKRIERSSYVAHSSYVFNSRYVAYSYDCLSSDHIFGCTHAHGERFKILNVNVKASTYFKFMRRLKESCPEAGVTSIAIIKSLCEELEIGKSGFIRRSLGFGMLSRFDPERIPLPTNVDFLFVQ